MDKYCIFCGDVLVKGRCLNPECYAYNQIRSSQESLENRKPITLQERRRRMQEAEGGDFYEDIVEDDAEEQESSEYGENKTSDDRHPPYEVETDPETGEVIGFVSRERETIPAESEETPPPRRATDRGSSETVRREECSHHREESSHDTEVRSHNTNGRSRKSMRKPPREKVVFSDNALARLYYFVCDYFKAPGKVVAAAARKRDAAIGMILMFASILLSTLGTLLFGTMYLDDFFVRWIGCGLVVPGLAYGLNLLYGSLYVMLSPTGRERRKDPARGPVTFRELFAVVTVSSVFPNLILLLSCVLAPMDNSLRIFQFFALLLTVTWIVSLLLSLFTVYGGEFSLGGLCLTIVFGFFAFLAMRALWVWFLTGDFTFAFHIPLSVFLTG